MINSISSLSNIQGNGTVQNYSTNAVSNNLSGENEEIYNGSGNNYLSELYVNGFDLDKEFKKENTTYFLTVSNDIESIDVVATKEDDNSTVCIYGNENLQEGNNKILISVTAENGSVKNYRIYVTKES